MDDMLVIDHFRPHVGKLFRFLGTEHALPLDRIVSRHEEPPSGTARIPFTLIFVGPKAGEHLREGYYECVVEDGPTFALYVNPVHTPDPGRQEYQAAFN